LWAAFTCGSLSVPQLARAATHLPTVEFVFTASAAAPAQLNSAIEELNQKTRRPLSRKVLQAIAAADPATNSAVHQLRIPGLSNKAKEQYGALLQPRLLILTGTCQRCMRRSKQQLYSH